MRPATDFLNNEHRHFQWRWTAMCRSGFDSFHILWTTWSWLLLLAGFRADLVHKSLNIDLYSHHLSEEVAPICPLALSRVVTSLNQFFQFLKPSLVSFPNIGLGSLFFGWELILVFSSPCLPKGHEFRDPQRMPKTYVYCFFLYKHTYAKV